MSAIWARLRRVWSRDADDDTKTLVNEPADTPNNSERRRDAFRSFGRGRIGNVRRISQSHDSHPINRPLADGSSGIRGREPVIHSRRVFSVGRGGAGNIRFSPRDALI
ncbi:hypothetical protein OG21DRAFT_285348 [Imleria badia]|nr:hypothetical protein OG21DRAFT_285348 [Imleria badia]